MGECLSVEGRSGTLALCGPPQYSPNHQELNLKVRPHECLSVSKYPFPPRVDPNFPLKLSGTAQGSREEKQVHKYGSRVARTLGIYRVSGSGGPALGLGWTLTV